LESNQTRERNPLLGTWVLLVRLAGAAWLPLLLLYFVLVGGTFWGGLNGGVGLVNLWVTVALLTAMVVSRWRRDLPLLPRTPLDGLLLAWAALLALSTALSVCKRLSLEVSVQQLWYFALFYLAVALGQTPSGRRRAGGALAAAGVAAVLVGLFQFSRWLLDPARDMTGAGQRVLQSTFNSPNDFASFLTLLLPLTLASFVPITHSVRRRAAGAALFLVTLFCLVLTYSRAGWLAAPFAAGALVLLLVRSEHLPRFRDLFSRNKLLVCVGVLGFLCLLHFSPGGWLSYRLKSLVTLKDMGATQRVVIWRAAWEMAADRPWTGWGGGTFPLKFTQYLPPDASRELLLHAHNQYLHLAAENGFPVALLFLAAGLAGVAVGWRRLRAGGEQPDLVRAAAVAAIAGHLLFMAFNAETAIPSLAGTYWILLGLAVSGGDETRRERPAGGRRTALFAVAAATGAVVAGMLRYLSAQQCYEASLRANSPAQQTQTLWRATSLDPRHPAYRAALGAAWHGGKRLDRALRECALAVDLSPHDAVYWSNLGWVSYWKGGLLDRATRCFERAIELDPGNPFYRISLARVQHRYGRTAAAEKTLRNAGRTGFALPEVRWELAKVLAEAGRYREAAAECETCLRLLRERETAPGLWVPPYQVGTRYRRLPRQNEVLTEVAVLRKAGPVRSLLARCRDELRAEEDLAVARDAQPPGDSSCTGGSDADLTGGRE
jgi:Flp pilus assembly protein TadD